VLLLYVRSLLVVLQRLNVERHDVYLWMQFARSSQARRAMWLSF